MVQIVRASVSGSIAFAVASCHLVVRVVSLIRIFQFEKEMWRVTLAAAPSVVHHCVGFSVCGFDAPPHAVLSEIP